MSDAAFQAAEASRRLDLVVVDGVIDSVDHVAARVRVRIEDELVTDDLPWIEPFGGRVRSWSPPQVGEPVVVLCPSGEPTQGRVLRGVDSDSFARPFSTADVFALLWDEDGLLDTYDHPTRTRTLRVPAGGRTVVEVEGGGRIEITDRLIRVEAKTVTVEATNVTLKAATLLLGPDGVRKAIARHGDPVVQGAIVASSTSVKSA